MSDNEQSGYINPKMTPEQLAAAKEKLGDLYQDNHHIYMDIMTGRNLEIHKRDVQGAIAEVNKKLDAALPGSDKSGLLDLKNFFFELLYEISLHEDNAT